MVDWTAEEVVWLPRSFSHQSVLSVMLRLSCPQELTGSNFSTIFIAGLAVLGHWLE